MVLPVWCQEMRKGAHDMCGLRLRRWRVWERQLRAIGCWAVFFAMLAFYLPVVTAIQALLQVRWHCPSTVIMLCMY